MKRALNLISFESERNVKRRVNEPPYEEEAVALCGINDLPDEIVIEIAKHLHTEELKNRFALVALRFARLWKECVIEVPKGSHLLSSDAYLGTFRMIESLNLAWNEKITDAALMKLTNLTSLNLCYNENITDAALTTLTHLTQLNLRSNANITDALIEKIKRINPGIVINP